MDSPRPRPRTRSIVEGYVYFIKPIGLDGPIKIGWAVDPERRLRDMATGSPFPLEIIGVVRGEMSDERALHRHFDAFRYHREWFLYSPALRGHVNRVIAVGSVHALHDEPALLTSPRNRTASPQKAAGISRDEVSYRRAKLLQRDHPEG